MSSLFDSIGKAIQLTQTLLKAKEALENADVKMALANLSLELAEMKIQAAEILQENTNLKEQVRQLSAPPPVTVRSGVYFTESGDGPFCTTCYDAERRLIRLHEMSSAFAPIGKWRCGVCKSKFSGT